MNTAVLRGAGFAGRCQHGQALVEFIVIAVALVPLFLLMPLIGKYQDIVHATQMASRYAAFDAFANNPGPSAWKPESELADEVRRRFFSDPAAPIKTGEAAGDFADEQRPLWHGVGDRPLIDTLNRDVTLGFGEAAATDHDAGFSESSDGTPFTLRQPLQLKARGVYTASVSVVLADLPAGLKFYEPFDELALRVKRSTSVVVDPWTARGPDDVERRIAADSTVFPAAALGAVAARVVDAVPVIDFPGLITAPRLGQLEFWRDVVPDDRLKRAP